MGGAYEADLHRIYSSVGTCEADSDVLEGKPNALQHADLRTLTPTQVAQIRNNLKLSFRDGSTFMDRVAFFRPRDFERRDLAQFVKHKLEGSGVIIGSGSGFTMVQTAMLHSMLAWEANRDTTAGRAMLGNVLSVLLPDSQPLNSLRDVFEKLNDHCFHRTFLALDNFLPRLIWVQDLVAQKTKVHQETLMDNIGLLNGGLKEVGKVMQDLPGKSLSQKLRDLFRPIKSGDAVKFYVETEDGVENSSARLLYRLSVLGVFFPDLRERLYARWQIELELHEYVAALVEIVGGWCEVMRKVQDVLEIYLEAHQDVCEDLATRSIAQALSPESVPDQFIRGAVINLLVVKTATESSVAHARVMEWRSSKNSDVAELIDIARDSWGRSTDLY